MHNLIEKYNEYKTGMILNRNDLKLEEIEMRFRGNKTQNWYRLVAKQVVIRRGLFLLSNTLLDHYETYGSAFIPELSSEKLRNELRAIQNNNFSDEFGPMKKVSTWRRR